MEKWKNLEYKHFEHIAISSTGRVLNTSTGDMLSPRVHPHCKVMFLDISNTIDGIRHRKTIYVHREVANAFVKKPEDFDKVEYKATHIKGKMDNRYQNIKWVSQSELSTKAMLEHPENRNKLADYNKEKFKDYPKKKYTKVADRKKPKPTKESKSSNTLVEDLVKEKENLKSRIQQIDKLLELYKK